MQATFWPAQGIFEICFSMSLNPFEDVFWSRTEQYICGIVYALQTFKIDFYCLQHVENRNLKNKNTLSLICSLKELIRPDRNFIS